MLSNWSKKTNSVKKSRNYEYSWALEIPLEKYKILDISEFYFLFVWIKDDGISYNASRNRGSQSHFKDRFNPFYL